MVTQTASIGRVMVEGILQNAEELQAAVQAFMSRLDACLEIIELLRTKMFWECQHDVIVRTSLVSVNPVGNHLLSNWDLIAQPSPPST
jgi:hypothetical protein